MSEISKLAKLIAKQENVIKVITRPNNGCYLSSKTWLEIKNRTKNVNLRENQLTSILAKDVEKDAY